MISCFLKFSVSGDLFKHPHQTLQFSCQFCHNSPEVTKIRTQNKNHYIFTQLRTEFAKKKKTTSAALLIAMGESFL